MWANDTCNFLAILDVKNLRQVRAQKEGFKSLKLPGGHKKMVQALVKTHFAEKIATSLETPERYEVDVVRGKGRFLERCCRKTEYMADLVIGRGLIVLLHGAPGVGKTSTAGQFMKTPSFELAVSNHFRMRRGSEWQTPLPNHLWYVVRNVCGNAYS